MIVTDNAFKVACISFFMALFECLKVTQTRHSGTSHTDSVLARLVGLCQTLFGHE